MTEFSYCKPEESHKKIGLLRRLAGKSLAPIVEAPAEQASAVLTPDGVPKSIQRITTIDPTSETPSITRTYKNW